MDEEIIDRKTAAFYLTMLALIVLDLVLLFWMFSPFNHLGSAYASEKPATVSDSAKPSPFDSISGAATRH